MRKEGILGAMEVRKRLPIIEQYEIKLNYFIVQLNKYYITSPVHNFGAHLEIPRVVGAVHAAEDIG